MSWSGATSGVPKPPERPADGEWRTSSSTARQPADCIRLLLIEDDPDDAFLIREFLSEAKRPRFELVHGERLEDAITRLDDERFDVAVLDLTLPDCSGPETLARLRAEAPDLPIVILTGRDDEELAAQSLHEGAQDYLVKTWVDRDLLVRAVLYAIERKEAEDELRTKVHQQETISALGLKALEITNVAQLLPEATRMIATSLGVPFVGVERCTEDGTAWRLESGSGWTSTLIGAEVAPTGLGMLSDTVLVTEGVIEVDAEGDHPFELPIYLRAQQVRRGVATRIPTGGRPWGVLSIWDRRDRVFSPDQVLFLRSVASLLGLAVRRIREEEERRRARAIFRELVERLREGIIVTDAEGRIVYGNPRAAEFLQLREAGLAGVSIRDFVGEGDREPLLRRLANPRDGSGERIEIQLIGSDRERRWVEVSTTPLVSSELEGGNALVLITDINERKMLEERVLQSHKMEAIGRMAGGVAHDFNNLLAVIHGYGEILQLELPEGSEAQANLEQILQAAQRARNVTGQLLAISRNKSATKRMIDLNDHLREVEKMFRRFVGERVELAIDPADGLAPVRADPGHVEQILLNLVVNARDAMPDGGRIEIRTRSVELTEPTNVLQGTIPAGRYSVLEVADTGTGIPDDIRGRIFEPFFTTKAEQKGTGLGLSIVYGLAHQQGGHLDLETEPGVGSAFRVFLPAQDGVAEPAAAPAPSAPVSPAGRRVLVVEDQAPVRRMLERMLRTCGYDVTVAANGAEGLRRLETEGDTIDLVIADVVMPVMGGIELRQRASESSSPTPFILMTGFADTDGSGVELTGTVLEKPFSIQAVRKAVAAVLEGDG